MTHGVSDKGSEGSERSPSTGFQDFWIIIFKFLNIFGPEPPFLRIFGRDHSIVRELSIVRTFAFTRQNYFNHIRGLISYHFGSLHSTLTKSQLLFLAHENYSGYLRIECKSDI